MSETPEPAPANTERSPRRGMCAAVLSLEAIALGLTTPVMITIADVDTSTALSVGLGLAAVCQLLAGMLRAPWADARGWVLQVAAVAIGFLVPLLFVLGVVLGELVAAGGGDGQRHDAVALALDPAQHLAGEAAGEPVGLDQDQGPLSLRRHGAKPTECARPARGRLPAGPRHERTSPRSRPTRRGTGARPAASSAPPPLRRG